jgi:hypothetical protein
MSAKSELTPALLATTSRCLMELSERFGGDEPEPPDETADAIRRTCDAFDAFVQLVLAPKEDQLRRRASAVNASGGSAFVYRDEFICVLQPDGQWALQVPAPDPGGFLTVTVKDGKGEIEAAADRYIARPTGPGPAGAPGQVQDYARAGTASAGEGAG